MSQGRSWPVMSNTTLTRSTTLSKAPFNSVDTARSTQAPVASSFSNSRLSAFPPMSPTARWRTRGGMAEAGGAGRVRKSRMQTVRSVMRAR